jgi:hypothetical protein
MLPIASSAAPTLGAEQESLAMLPIASSAAPTLGAEQESLAMLPIASPAAPTLGAEQESAPASARTSGRTLEETAQAARALEALKAVDAFRPARTFAHTSARKAELAQQKPEQEKPEQEKPVIPEPKGKVRSFSKQGGKCQSPAGLSTLATLCSGLTTNSVGAGTVSPT